MCVLGGEGCLSRITVSPGHGQQIIALCVPTAQQAGTGTEWISVLVDQVTVVKVGQEGLNLGTKRETFHVHTSRSTVE